MGGVTLNSCMKCQTEAHRTKLNRSELDHAEPNDGLHHQIIMCRQTRRA